ncbi:hypothetical protein WICPIJ_002683 [Wickerhamomyces pijperi]|uniref:Secreted protein n=1 Tax=Wickerhamomyces pijperi TaxID=599730 RepID=A0A9P8Q9A8_WICPI|nr:hypothetical protein WICPIJ_002683 [Wickerhamomyces pijperi]
MVFLSKLSLSLAATCGLVSWTESTLISSLFPSLFGSLESKMVLDPMSLTPSFSKPPFGPSVRALKDPTCGLTASSSNGKADLSFGGFLKRDSLSRVLNSAVRN